MILLDPHVIIAFTALLVVLWLGFKMFSMDLQEEKEKPIDYLRRKKVGFLSSQIRSVKRYAEILDTYELRKPLWVCTGIIWFLVIWGSETVEISISNFVYWLGAQEPTEQVIANWIIHYLLIAPSFIMIVHHRSLIHAFQPSTRKKKNEDWADEFGKALLIAMASMLLEIWAFDFSESVLGIEIQNTQKHAIEQHKVNELGLIFTYPLVGYVEQGVWFAVLLVIYKVLRRTNLNPLSLLVIVGTLVCIVFGLLHITWGFVAIAFIAFSTMIWVIALFKYHSVNTIALAHVLGNTIISISRVLNGL